MVLDNNIRLIKVKEDRMHVKILEIQEEEGECKETKNNIVKRPY